MKSIPIIISYILPITIHCFTLNTQQRYNTFHLNKKKSELIQQQNTVRNNNVIALQMINKLDPITSLRTEWISAAICTNQTPRTADVALQLGCNDGRAVMFLPKTIRKLITSSNEVNGEINVTIKRQLNQQKKQRFGSPDESFGGVTESDRMIIEYYDNQRADNLINVDDESVDVVLSLQSSDIMKENGLDWKESINEAIRVLKPKGRLIFVEKTSMKYLDYLLDQEGIIWDSVGYDDIDLVITPHVAGVAIKSIDAGLTDEERIMKARQKEKDAEADIAINVFEGYGRRGKKKKKKKNTKNDE